MRFCELWLKIKITRDWKIDSKYIEKEEGKKDKMKASLCERD